MRLNGFICNVNVRRVQLERKIGGLRFPRREKEAHYAAYNTIFQTWLKTHSKVASAQNNHVIHHFGGMLAIKSSLRFVCLGTLLLPNGQMTRQIVIAIKSKKVQPEE